MKNLKLVTLGLCALLIFSNCSSIQNWSNQTKGTAIGGTGGAVVGGILGNIIGKNTGSTVIGAAVGAVLGAGTGAIIGNHMDKVKEQTAAQLPNAQVETVKDANGLSCVKVTFDSGLLFKTNKYDLNASAQNDLAKFANVLKQNSDCSVDIQGYTDSTGTDAINNPLSVNRAQSVAQYLVSQGVPTAQFKNVSGFGSSNPVADNSTEAGRQKNRRVEVYLYASQEMIDKANAGTL